MKKLFLILSFLLLPAQAHALSCVYLTPEQAKDTYPVAIHGKVISSEPVKDEEMVGGGMIRILQRVEMDVEHVHGIPKDSPVKFTEAVTIYDGGSRFRVGQDYVVFLQQDEKQGLMFSVCGYAFSPSQSGVEWEEVRQVMGW